MADFDHAAIVAAACSWPGVEAGAGSGGGGDNGDNGAAAVVLSADGRAFASISAGGVELVLPPRVRNMLVETGRAVALWSPTHALVTPYGDGAIDLDLVRLAYERARVTRAYRTRDQPR